MEVLLLPPAPYTDPRQRLLASHQLTDIQQVEQFTIVTPSKHVHHQAVWIIRSRKSIQPDKGDLPPILTNICLHLSHLFLQGLVAFTCRKPPSNSNPVISAVLYFYDAPAAT